MTTATPAADPTTLPRAVLARPALDLVTRLHREFEPERRRLLAARADRQVAWNAGALPGYLEGGVTDASREPWQIALLPADLRCRRVEITGPVDDPRKVIRMLSRGDDGARADCALLDFEDALKPEWPRVLAGLDNIARAARGDLTSGELTLDPSDQALLMVRCRGLHLAESNLVVDGAAVSAGLFDLTLTAWHAAKPLLARGCTPKFYLAKGEHHLEARWWNQVFRRLEEELALAPGTLRVTFLIETLPAAFQMEEILWELRERAAGLNVGRWDKIFSDIKVLAEHPERVLADRATLGLDRPWMRAYAEELVRVCHRHGAFAMGGMAAFTPGRTPERRAEQTARVRADKELEAALGHDGCWVSHPYFITTALAAFPRQNQLDVVPPGPPRPDLLPQGGGPRTLAGLAKNARVGIAYLEGWERGLGCVAWDDLMEDLATLEISRAQTWQWLRHGVALDDGPRVTAELVRAVFAREASRIDAELATAPYADLLWCETSQPDLAEARAFAEAIHTRFPGKLLAYNCSPSFNWQQHLDAFTLRRFQRELGALGYKFQFVTLAGFHALNYSMFTLARDYRDHGMWAYSQLQEREFAGSVHV